MKSPININGVDIHYEIRGTGEPLVLLHGFTGSSQDWNSSIETLESEFQLIVPDLRGHGRSSVLAQPFHHLDAADDIQALLDHAGVQTYKAIGVSAGGNILLHLATREPERVKAMVLVSATPYFPAPARAIMRTYAAGTPEGDARMKSLVASTAAFADSYDDMNFTPPYLATIQARTLIVQGDRDPLYPVEISVDMARAIPQSSLWIVPDSGHGAVFGDKWNEFLKTSAAFLRESHSA